MNKYEKIVVALLVAVAIEGAVTTAQIMRIARNGFEVELSEVQAEELASEVNEAREAAVEDMNEEGE